MKNWNGIDAGCGLVMNGAAEVRGMRLVTAWCGEAGGVAGGDAGGAAGLLPAGLRGGFIW